ncbi:MAG: Type-1 restriction enzyme R protein [Firmicutes bacterium ADurb.BinA205]|nr:MAG: Type-1 restriction enzyme R protein [Firmicutes bacterium ADurb.BinA205]
MTNFEFLSSISEYVLFSGAAIEAEKVYSTSPAMCAVGCRRALELAVKWVYSADRTITLPYKDNLQSLIHEPSFRFALDSQTWGKLPFIIRLGNLAVHTERAVNPADALLALESLFEFIEWVDYCYGSDYVERHFDAALIPTEKVVIDTKKIKEQESLIVQQESEIKALQAKIAAMSATLTAEKEEKQESRTFAPTDISEFKTRKIYIDVDLKSMGWKFGGNDADVWEEYPVTGMPNATGEGFVDYVLFGKDGLPLAVIEAKRSSKDPNIGRKQAVLYADCLECKFGRRPMMFTTNGFETFFWDDMSSPQRRVSGFFTKADLEKLMNRRDTRKKLKTIAIDEKITDRYYQIEAIRAVSEHFEEGFRKALIVMATGTGKTRTASSLTDVLSRGGYITNILFLADRTALVKQAKDDFKNYLPDMSLCNLCSNKDDKTARIVFSTYPTILNAIDSTKTKDGIPLFSPAHFDLIITDESHRSIFKKYRAIFEYFDALMVGLTATPKTDVDRNTYDFFEVENGVPTYAYDYETAVYIDHYLVPYYNYEVKTKFLEEGITYDDLSEADKERYEDDFAEDDYIPDFIPSAALNKFVFNETTVDIVLQDLMERGIKVEGGDRLGKTIIFAQSKEHAEFIIQRFNKLYPKYNGKFAQRITCSDSYAQTIIDDFKQKDMPVIAVSVDMMDTGVDVPSCVNLVFFKKVRSKTKFWQMIGRGTRLCEGLSCTDGIDGEYTDKKRFLIFDYCGNFEYFREHQNGYETGETKSLTENIFCKQVQLITALQDSRFVDADYQAFRSELVATCYNGVCALSDDLVSVRLQKQYVEKYRKRESFKALSEMDKYELTKYIAGLITSNDTDEFAKRFDNFMYGLMLANIDQLPKLGYFQKQLVLTAELLEKKSTIPQVKVKLTLIKDVQTDAFWENISILTLEMVRQELRELMQFLVDDNTRPKIFTRLDDPVIDKQEGEVLDAAYDFEDYKKKVNRYIEEHKNDTVIYKLNHNLPLTKQDYDELERILTQELGDSEDYKREYGDTPFGLLVRKIAKLDHESAMAAFSSFINDSSLNQRQIEFILKIINHIENNGYIEDVKILMKPPFDKPFSFIKMFDAKTRTALLQTIEGIKNNALQVVA